MKKSPLFAAVATLVLSAAGHAAVLTGSLNTTPPAAVNLTTEGSVDWALWNYQTNTGLSTRGPSVKMAGGTNLVSAISPVGTGNVRGTTSTPFPPELYTYTNGVDSNGQAVPNLTSTAQSYVFNSGVGTAGRGLELSITGDPSKVYKVDLWTSGYFATGTLTATLAGTSGWSGSNSFTNKTSALYSFTFQPNSVTDKLLLQYIQSDLTDGSGHVGIQAVTVSVIPEPTTALLLLGGAGVLAFVRRTRRS